MKGNKFEKKNIAEDLEKLKQKRDERNSKNNNQLSKGDNFELMIKKKKQTLNVEPEEVSYLF